jgi:hypothetical protein
LVRSWLPYRPVGQVAKPNFPIHVPKSYAPHVGKGPRAAAHCVAVEAKSTYERQRENPKLGKARSHSLRLAFVQRKHAARGHSFDHRSQLPGRSPHRNVSERGAVQPIDGWNEASVGSLPGGERKLS